MYPWVVSNHAFSCHTAFARQSFDDLDRTVTPTARTNIVVKGIDGGVPEAEAPDSAFGETTTIGYIILHFAFGSQGAIVDHAVDMVVLGFFAESLVA